MGVILKGARVEAVELKFKRPVEDMLYEFEENHKKHGNTIGKDAKKLGVAYIVLQDWRNRMGFPSRIKRRK